MYSFLQAMTSYFPVLRSDPNLMYLFTEINLLFSLSHYVNFCIIIKNTIVI